MDQLIIEARRITVQGAREYLNAHNLRIEDYEAFSNALKEGVKDGLLSALDDAKKALDLGMPQVAEQTFAASMILVGIEAAKKCGVTA